MFPLIQEGQSHRLDPGSHIQEMTSSIFLLAAKLLYTEIGLHLEMTMTGMALLSQLTDMARRSQMTGLASLSQEV